MVDLEAILSPRETQSFVCMLQLTSHSVSSLYMLVVQLTLVNLKYCPACCNIKSNNDYSEAPDDFNLGQAELIM